MKKSGKSILYLAIVILVIAIAILIGIIINLSKANNLIGKHEENQGQQLTETTSSNAYVDMETHLSEVNAKQQEIDNIEDTAGKATATASQILKNYTAYKDGQLITGTMANNGAVSQALNAGGSYTIPAGYHNGSGKVTANSLSSQTSATATETDIVSGKTAWVNGELITGTATDSTEILENISAHLTTQSKTTSIQLNGVGYVRFSVKFSFDHKVVGIVPANECIGVRSISGNTVNFQYNSTYESNTDKTSVTVKAIGY